MKGRNPKRRAAARDRAPKPEGRGRSKSPAKVAAARRNGARGGRPAAELPEDLAKLVGEAPLDNPLQQNSWGVKVLLLLTQARLRGEPGIDSIAKEVRANLSVAAKLQPHALVFEAARALKEEEQGRNAEDGPAEEELDGVDGAPGALRSDPP